MPKGIQLWSIYYSKTQVYLTALACLFCICLGNAIHSYFLGFYALGLGNLIVGFITFINLYAIKKGFNYTACVNCTLLTSLIHITYVCLLTGLHSAPSAIWLVSLPIAASFLLSVPNTIGWLVLTILSYLFMNIFNSPTIIGSKYIMTSTLRQEVYIANVIAFSLLYTFFSMAYHKRTNLVFTENARKRDELNNIIRIVSHDVSNPLHIIKMQTNSFLKKEDVDSRITTGLLKINRSSQMIEGILQKVRNAEFIEQGVQYISKEALPILEIIHSCQFIFEYKLKEKNIKLKVISELQKETKVIGESIGFSHQLINNLISNSIKFSMPDSEVLIKLYERRKYVFIEIEDQGIGIPTSIVKNIFNKKMNRSRKGTNGEMGTGFGMPLVKDYLDQYKGSILIETRDISFHPNDHGTIIKIGLEKA
jgi:signal transduction histidine kinase